MRLVVSSSEHTTSECASDTPITEFTFEIRYDGNAKDVLAAPPLALHGASSHRVSVTGYKDPYDQTISCIYTLIRHNLDIPRSIGDSD